MTTQQSAHQTMASPRGLILPKGFKAAGAMAKIKPSATKNDVAVIYSERMAHAAAVYTTNRVKAAPLWVTRDHLSDGRAQAIVANSGNANACTGAQGRQDAEAMCRTVGMCLGIRSEDVIVASTGVIGQRLPMDRVEVGIRAACAGLRVDGGMEAAEAIMTTDTVPKTATTEVSLSDGPVRISGMCKGSGMIAPQMALLPHATMLAFLMTDAVIAPDLLLELLVDAVDQSFNRITVDGDMSTNDVVAILANAMSGGSEIVQGSEEATRFAEALNGVCLDLAKMIARDGEGATKLVTISVTGARDSAEAKRVGMSVANSNLVKTALFGNDPNWGRILAAVGYSGVEVDEERITLTIGDLKIFDRGSGVRFPREVGIEVLRKPEVEIRIDLGRGTAEATVYTCDLSYDYVRINAEYTT